MAPDTRRTRTREYEYRTVVFPPGVKRGDWRKALADEAEYGDWELKSFAVYFGGVRKALVRRRVVRTEITL